MNRTILHVSEVDITPLSGMGRVEFYWKNAFESAGVNFLHIGPKEIGEILHKGLFSRAAYRYYKKLKLKPDLFIVHEAAASYFVNRKIPCIIESHGVERNHWEYGLERLLLGDNKITFKTKFLYPLWRLRGCDRGLKYADKLLLINTDDKNYVKSRYKRQDKDIFLFKNGVELIDAVNIKYNTGPFTVLFNGSWIERKGIDVLVKSAQLIYNSGLSINYLIIGTGKDSKTVLEDWPEELRPYVMVINNFEQQQELNLLNSASVFVLPSYLEGQPLSLLQAMAAAKCCITTNCCGQKDIIQNEVTGLFFERGDYEKLAELIIYTHNNKDVVKQIGINAKKYIDSYTWKNVSNDVVDFVLDI